jgi:NACHT domain
VPGAPDKFCYREQVSRSNLEQICRLDQLDSTTKNILDAIIRQQDVFSTVEDIQLTLRTVWQRQEQSASLAEQDRCLSKLPNTPQAAFNSFDKQHDPICLPDTRTDLLKEIMVWADGLDERCIFWLNGLAGTGKSTIARTIARKYHEQHRLGASFFFSRGGGDVSHAGNFFASIARQLASISPSLRQYICEAVAEHSDISSRSLRDQWQQLIFQPLSRIDDKSSQAPLVLVVDALDECEGEKDIEIIIQLLAEARSLTEAHLRIFITSRPEVPIRHGLYQIPEGGHQDFILHNISPAIVDHDIALFLEHSFRTIRKGRALSTDWPGEQVIRRLVRNASGLFIWAATACRFISQGRGFAIKRLSMILQEQASATAPEKTLNEIYATVLRNSVGHDYDDQEKEELCENLRKILGSIVVLFSPLSANSLSRLLHVPREEIDQTLEDLHAILDVPDDQTRPLRLHHPSFRDFLLNKDRCSDALFWVDENQAHRGLVDHCIKLMSTSLKRDICDLQAPGTLTTEIKSSRVQQCLSSEVQYACIYWVQHIQRSRTQLYDDDQVHRFLQKYLLHWLEALSLMGKTPEGVLALTSLVSYIPVSHLI